MYLVYAGIFTGKLPGVVTANKTAIRIVDIARNESLLLKPIRGPISYALTAYINKAPIA